MGGLCASGRCAQGLAGGVSACFFAASVAAFAASSADCALGDGVVPVASDEGDAGAAGAGAGAGAGAAGGATTAGGGSSFFPHAVSAAAATSDASSTCLFISRLLWMGHDQKILDPVPGAGPFQSAICGIGLQAQRRSRKAGFRMAKALVDPLAYRSTALSRRAAHAPNVIDVDTVEKP